MGGLYKRPARVEDIEELFGIRGAAHGPKPASDSTGHDGHIMVVVRHNAFLNDSFPYQVMQMYDTCIVFIFCNNKLCDIVFSHPVEGINR